ncbi:ATP phosphoribosyltransferase [Patescibacteria group bacterium]
MRIAIQKKGRLRELSLNFLKSLGLEFDSSGNELITKCLNADIELLFVRNSDIPQYVKQKAADLGIVGENVLVEKKSRLKIIKRLGFGVCSLIIAAPGSSDIQNLNDLEGERIATSYPNSLKEYLQKNNLSASIIEIKGSVEIAPKINLADAVCDIKQTGTTLKDNNLIVIDTILNSEAVLIKNNYLTKDYENLFTKKLGN